MHKIDPNANYPIPQDLDHPLFRQFYAYWRGGFDGNRLPSKSGFDPLANPELLGHLNIARVEREGENMRFRFTLWGTAICDLFGGDFTGCFVDEMMQPTNQGSVQDAFLWVVETGQPHFWHVQVPRADREFAAYRRLALPYADQHGTHVSHIIALMLSDCSD